MRISFTRSLGSLAAGLMVFTAACADTTAPEAAPDQGLLVTAADQTAPDLGHLVMFKGKGPKNFEATVAALGGTVDRSHSFGVALVSGLSDEAAVELAGVSGIAEVMQDEVFMLDDVVGDAVAGDGIMSAGDPTTAFFYARQWNMRAIGADQAWARGRLGSPDVTIAILDTGIDYTYPDLVGRVDLSRSASFLPQDDALVQAVFPGAHPIADLHYHGTHVASTAVSNGDVIAGVTSQATLMGVKVCSVYGGCPTSAVVFGLLHAADNGADVVNMSLGGGFFKAGSKGFAGFVNSLFNHVQQQGVVIVVAAGNSGLDLDHIGNIYGPTTASYYATYCDTPATMCVAATAPASSGGTNGPWFDVDTPASYTNFGKSAIDVAAPGGGSGTSVWSACSRFSLVVPVCGTGTYVLGLGGTSMATPHVAGLAALVVEDVGRNPGRVKAIIGNGADDVGKKGRDAYSGKGRINVDATAN